MLTALVLTVLAAPQAPQFDDSRQIRWQRTLTDALHVAAESGTPILVAINADGESASERIVRERYRDPQWVAWTRSFTCVVGTVFRHSLRDYDEEGRRIPCPRLGEVTCGEHIAMEPAVHERWLAGERIELDGGVTDRVSPRHALILPDGTKAWDLYLLFDLRDLDAKLAESAQQWPAQQWMPKAEPELGAPPRDRRHRSRLAFEQVLARRDPEDVALQLRDAAVRDGAVLSGSTGALRRLLPRLDASSPEVRDALFDLAAPAGETDALAWAIRDTIASASSVEESARRAERLLPAIPVLAGSSPANRTWLISHAVVTYGGRPAWDALSELAPEADAGQDRKAVHVLDFVRASPVEPKRATRPETALREVGVLEEELAAVDDALSKARTDPEANLRFGRTALELARRKIQDGGGSGIDLLLEDARTALARAAESRPDDVALALDRARVANLLSRFEEQEQIAGAALERSGELWNRSGPTLTDEQVEACRWLGDASARLLTARSGKDMAVEAAGIFRGGLAFALAASSLESDPTDWLSLASYFAALGRTRERVELVYEGLRRFPASEDLRRELTNACWSLGRPDLLARLSQELAIEQPAWAESEWYAGYALVLYAESLRRVEDADGAISAYSSAEQHFAAALELEPGFRDSSEHYLGMCALGRGFANLLANRRAEAAQCVVEAAKVRPQTFAQRDGLEREGVDLVDGVLEWRASGASPVDALAWIDDLLRANPGNATWPRTISDAQLREGLRAFGRDAPEEGDAYLAKAVEAARRAVDLDPSDANRRALAQASNVTAERLLERGSELERARALVAEAAGLVEVEPPAPNAALEEIRKSAAAVRSKLGAARPVFRPGR